MKRLPAQIIKQRHRRVTTIPKGVVYLPSNRIIDPAVLAVPSVDGVLCGCTWSDIEPTEGNYRFDTAASGQSLATLIAAAETAGKFMGIAILTGGPGLTDGGDKPDWLITKITNDSYGATKFFTFDSGVGTVTIPVFWEPTLLSKHALVAAALGAYLAGHSLVKYVYVPYINALTIDFNPGSISSANDSQGTSPKSRWLATIPNSGYANWGAAVISAGKATYDAYFSAFPNKVLNTSIGRINDPELNPGGVGNNGSNISSDVVLYANGLHPGQCVAGKMNLNGGGVPHYPGTGNAWEDVGTIPVPHFGQMTWNCYQDTACSANPAYPYSCKRMNFGVNSPCVNSTDMLRAAVDTGKTYNTMWQEIYELDIANLGAGNQDPLHVGDDVISYAHGLLA